MFSARKHQCVAESALILLYKTHSGLPEAIRWLGSSFWCEGIQSQWVKVTFFFAENNMLNKLFEVYVRIQVYQFLLIYCIYIFLEKNQLLTACFAREMDWLFCDANNVKQMRLFEEYVRIQVNQFPLIYCVYIFWEKICW